MDEAWTDPDFQPFSEDRCNAQEDWRDEPAEETDWNFDPGDFDLATLIPLWDERDKTLAPF